MGNSNIAGYDITKDPFAPNLLHDAPTPEGEADISASASVDASTGTPSVQVTKTKTGQSTYNFAFAFHNLKGQQGETGSQGIQGERGPQGIQGIRGETGATGEQGVGVASVTYDSTDAQGNNIYKINLTNGTWYLFTAPRGAQGEQGIQGPQGIPGTGEDGVGISSIVFKETDASGNNVYTIILSNNNTYDITCPKGSTGATGETGPAGADGRGVPTGGTAGQVLSKVDSTDYNCQWINPPSSGLELLGAFTLTGETKTFNISQSYQWGNQSKALDPFSLEINPNTFEKANPNISSTTITATKDIAAGSCIYLGMGSGKSITPYISITNVTFTNCLYGVATNSSNSRNYLSNDSRMYLMKIYNVTKGVDVTNNVAFRDTGRIAFDLYSSSRAHYAKLGTFEILVEILSFITKSAISAGDVLSLVITHSVITPHRGLVQPELIPSSLSLSNPPYATLTIVGSGFSYLPDPISLYV